MGTMTEGTTTMEATNMADGYAATIAEHVQTLEALLCADGDVVEAVLAVEAGDDDDDVRELADELAPDVREVVVEHGGDDASEVVHNAVGEWPLEVTVERGQDGGVRAVRLLVTFGGPTCWVKVDGSEYVRVWAGWGGDEGRRVVSAGSFDTYWFELAEDGMLGAA